MGYISKIAALGLASMLSVGNAEMQAPKQQKSASASAYQRKASDGEFLKLYDDVKWFEDKNRANRLDELQPQAASARAFGKRAARLAERYDDIIGPPVKVYTCGKHVAIEFDRKEFLSGEFFSRISDYGKGPFSLRKVFVKTPKNLHDRKEIRLPIPEGYNMQPASEVSFASLHEAVSLYNLQLRAMSENDRFTRKGYCISDQLDSIGRDLWNSAVGKSYFSGSELDVRAPKGTNRIIVAATGDYKGKLGIFSLSISPDGLTDLWFKELADDTAHEIEEWTEARIKFGKN